MQSFFEIQDEDAPSLSLSEAKLALLRQRLCGIANTAAERIEPRAPGEAVPISVDQYRIWLHAETAPGIPLYNEAITLHRKGSFDAAVFHSAFNEILRRHEAWRSSFTQAGGELTQIFHCGLKVSFPFTDLTTLPEREREAAALEIAARDARTPIPLDKAPLMRGHIVRMAEGEHRVYLTLHHIVFDGVSIYRILMPELMSIYSAYAAGRNHSLPEPALQYGDYAVWRRRQARSSAMARHLAYWKENLSGELPVLELPVDRARPARPSGRGSMECFSLSNELIDALRIVARNHGVTLYMLLLASYKALLFRLSGQQDLIVGGAADARRQTELEGVMGYMLETIPIRTRPSCNTSFSQFLLEVRDSVLGALAAAEVPFDEIVRAIGGHRGNHSPIFQAFFSIEPPAPAFIDGWDLTQMDVTVGAAKFDLYLELDERPEALAARFLYNTDIFDAATIRRMAGHWRVILESLPDNSNCPLGSLPVLTAAEVAQRLGPGGWNDTEAAFPQVPLHSLVEAQAKCTPHAPAIAVGERTWDYADLMKRVDELSAGLLAAGVKRGDLVAVHLQRSADLVAGLLAILKAGAAYMPLEPEAPSARLALLIDNAKPEFILADSSAPNLLLSLHSAVLLVEELAREGRRSSPASVAVTPDDVAYVINTSGTTGIPKGVEITHRSLVNALLSFQKQPGFTPRDRMLGITTISFDIAGLELFLPLISGGMLILESRAVALDPHLLAASIESSCCTVMQATPATWVSLLTSGWKGTGRPLKALCGGEALTRELADSLLDRGVELWNLYGPTEATIWATVHRIKRDGTPISIGRPIDNMTAYVLDANRQLVPAGVAGTLYLGGVGVARGYYRNPKATAERFIYAESVGGARLYNTGDIAVQRADGTIECRGRADNQVKVRGYRIELEAVEAAVRRHPRVAAAAARVWPDAAGSNRLSVYLTGKDGPPPDAATLRRFLKQDQPEWMIPSDVITLDAIPVSIAGKVDRAKLPAPRVQESVHPAKLENPIEQRLAAVWSDILNLPSVDRSANFFDLGGHSLLLATLSRRIELAFGRRLSIATLFQIPTLEGQAALLHPARISNSAAPALIRLQPRGGRPPIFWLHPPAHLVHLSEALGEDQPVFGVGLTEADLEKLGSAPAFENIAALHVQTILNAQVPDPFLIGGWCTGGIVAFETAVQLQVAGREPACVVLLDSQNPVFYSRIGSLSTEMSKAFFYTRQALTEVRPPHRATLAQRFMRLITFRDKNRLMNANAIESQLGQRMVDHAAYRYKPARYSGDVLLLQPRDRPSRVDHAPGWRAVVTGNLILEEVPGTHDEMLDRKNAHALARVIATRLNSAGHSVIDARNISARDAGSTIAPAADLCS